MPRIDRTKVYRVQNLAKDGSACERLTDRLRVLIADMHFEAAQASDDATAEALKDLARDLADAAHGPVSALAVAHDAACDEEGKLPFWQPGLALCVTVGMEAPAEVHERVDVS